MLTRDQTLADDLAQSTCERALHNAAKFQPGTALDRWTFTMARRLWLNDRRAVKVREGEGLISTHEHDLVDDKPSAEMNIFAREVFDKVQALPEAQRLAVLLVYVEGFAYREAAEMLDVPIGTVMSRLATARKTIVTQVREVDE